MIAKSLNLDLVINGSIKQGAIIFKRIDPTLSDEEARILSAGYILSPLLLLGSAQDVKFACSKIGTKLTFKDKVKIDQEFTQDINSFNSSYFKGTGSSSNILSKFGKTDIDIGSKFKFKDLEIQVIKGIEEFKLPVTKNAKNSVAIAMHDKYGKFFRDENLGTLNGDRLFWSKDTGKHGGSGYKLFIEKHTHFEMVANIAPDGKIIQNKHQSIKSKKIDKKELSWIKNSKE